ncbi:unnamed protein product [Trichobilharzia regenti]|nr:unnamed protein product [Trichobilharzia regenti]
MPSVHTFSSSGVIKSTIVSGFSFSASAGIPSGPTAFIFLFIYYIFIHIFCSGVTDQNSIGSSISRHQNISAGLLNDILNAVRGEVHAASDTTTDVSGHVTAAALDGLRDHLQHLLLCADSVTGSNQSELVNSLVSTIFRGRLSDACHSEYTLWINNFDENSSQKMIDVTASFAKLCRVSCC